MMTDIEKIFVFKTNIQDASDLEKIKPVLGLHKYIEDWHVDLEDSDRVLRITSEKLSENDIVKLLQQFGFHCRVLA